MQHVKHAIISAAGIGSRLGLNIPKCLLNIGEKKLIDYQLALLQNIEDVRVVVGFMEHEVMQYIGRRYDNVTFVRNPDFLRTSNSYSVYLATKDLNEPHVIVDGDLLIHKQSFYGFLEQCRGETSLIGICSANTEEAVYVDLDEQKNITAFQRQSATPYEWCGIAYLNKIKISNQQGYIFEELTRHLPLPGRLIDCYEIDTPADLEHALSKFHEFEIS